MVLVDTSASIHFLRPDGDGTVRARVEGVLRAGTARLCPLVSLELWNGAGGERERKVLRELDRSIPQLDVTAEVWGEARHLARRCRAAGVSVPATDLLIAACAFHHGATIEHEDADRARRRPRSEPEGEMTLAWRQPSVVQRGRWGRRSAARSGAGAWPARARGVSEPSPRAMRVEP